jgi:RNA polymerase sigma-70 factor (sigma-E family)
VRTEDEQRYEAYVRSRLPWIRKVAYLLCQDWHRADDIGQVAITRLYTHWATASRATDLDAYLRTMLLRVFLGERRTAWARRVHLSGEPVEPASAAAEDTAGRLAVRQALAEVAPRQRAVLVLRYYCDLSVDETAETLGCSVGTVKSQTARGLEALRRALQAREVPIERGAS